MTGVSPGFGIYVHWPFCIAKCPYCDFNSHVAETVDHDRWRSAFRDELGYYAALTPGRVVTSIFFGGGTPSLMQPQTVAAVIDRIAELWQVAPDVEITAEANPGSVDVGVFEGFAIAGVNRVSIGVQSFDAESLRFLGRKHDAAEARRAIELAARIFPRFSFDLIYALPGQTPAAWRAELAEGLAYNPRHLSAYQLTIEDGTKFASLYGQGAFLLPAPEQAADLYEATNAQMASAGLAAYEISNYAVPGEESRHNLTYWRYGDYVGVGPGAHGRLTLDGRKLATRAHRAPEKWLELVAANGHGAHEPDGLSAGQRFEEMMMMGLRLAEPLPLACIAAETGKGLYDWVPRIAVERLADENLLTVDDMAIATTTAGRQRLNAVLQFLIARSEAA